MTRTQLLPEILKLDPGDQQMIVEAIRNHLAGDVAPVSEAEFKAELARRITDADTNPTEESPLDEVVQRLRNRR